MSPQCHDFTAHCNTSHAISPHFCFLLFAPATCCPHLFCLVCNCYLFFFFQCDLDFFCFSARSGISQFLQLTLVADENLQNDKVVWLVGGNDAIEKNTHDAKQWEAKIEWGTQEEEKQEKHVQMRHSSSSFAQQQVTSFCSVFLCSGPTKMTNPTIISFIGLAPFISLLYPFAFLS